MKTPRFTSVNTTGYTVDQLVELNKRYETAVLQSQSDVWISGSYTARVRYTDNLAKDVLAIFGGR